MRSFAANCSALACLLAASWASAQTPTPAPAPAPAASASPADAATDAPLHVRDTLAGHVVAGGAGGFSWPLGRLDGRRLPSALFGSGLALNLDLGYGISRYIAVGAWAELDSYSAPDGCSACSGKGFAAGPFIRYHLVQGTRFDPWGSFALGFRSLSESSTNASYSGIDLARITLGGDFYPLSNVGFGPYLMMDIGTYTSHPAADGNASNKAFLNLGTGLRLVLDFPGK